MRVGFYKIVEDFYRIVEVQEGFIRFMEYLYRNVEVLLDLWKVGGPPRVLSPHSNSSSPPPLSSKDPIKGS